MSGSAAAEAQVLNGIVAPEASVYWSFPSFKEGWIGLLLVRVSPCYVKASVVLLLEM